MSPQQAPHTQTKIMFDKISNLFKVQVSINTIIMNNNNNVVCARSTCTRALANKFQTRKHSRENLLSFFLY